MPSPIGASPSPVTIPPVEIEGDAAPAAPRSPEPGGVVTIPPVYVEGRAESAARLVRQHDATKAARSCVGESVTAAYGAIEVAGAAGATILGTALGPAGVAVGLAAVAGLSYSEGQKLRALYDCVTE